MTFSIVAREPGTGHYGIAVASRFFAVGALVPHLRGGCCAVATQAFVSPIWGIEATDRMAFGDPSADVLADLVARDAGQAIRQVHMIDSAGRVATHTGSGCVDWCGHVAGDAESVAGNMLAEPAVVADALAAFEASGHLPLAERLMAAMNAGEEARGDKRGK